MDNKRVLLLGGNGGRWTAAQNEGERATMSGIESFVFAFNGEYICSSDATPEIINSYDIIIANTNGDRLDHLAAIQKQCKSSTKWVTLIEGCATDYLSPRPVLKQILDESDLVNVINWHSLDFFKSLTTAKCIYLGLPYDGEAIRNEIGTRTGGGIFVPPFLDGKSGYTSLLVVKDYSNLHAIMPQSRFAVSPDPKLTIHLERNQRAWLKLISQSAKVFVNMDSRMTWGRNILDCAALKIPCITTESPYHGNLFFPNLVVQNEFCFKEARDLLNKLLTDENFYRDNANVPISKFDEFKPVIMKNKMLRALYEEEQI